MSVWRGGSSGAYFTTVALLWLIHINVFRDQVPDAAFAGAAAGTFLLMHAYLHGWTLLKGTNAQRLVLTILACFTMKVIEWLARLTGI